MPPKNNNQHVKIGKGKKLKKTFEAFWNMRKYISKLSSLTLSSKNISKLSSLTLSSKNISKPFPDRTRKEIETG